VLNHTQLFLDNRDGKNAELLKMGEAVLNRRKFAV